jgi:hypothetical protein
MGRLLLLNEKIREFMHFKLNILKVFLVMVNYMKTL